MSRKLSLWLLAVAAAGVVVLGARREEPRGERRDEPHAPYAPHAPQEKVGAATARGPGAAPPVGAPGTALAVPEGAREAAPSAAEAGLAALPPEDVEWVLDAVARTESARELSEQDREALIAQLSSVRMHAVLERTEPMAVAPEVLP